MELFNGEDIYEIVSKGYESVFQDIFICEGTKCEINPNDKARALYEEHGSFTDEGYVLNEKQKVTIEATDDGLGVIFDDSLEIEFNKNKLPNSFYVEFSELDKLVIEYQMEFHTSYLDAIKQIDWVIKRLQG